MASVLSLNEGWGAEEQPKFEGKEEPQKELTSSEGPVQAPS